MKIQDRCFYTNRQNVRSAKIILIIQAHTNINKCKINVCCICLLIIYLFLIFEIFQFFLVMQSTRGGRSPKERLCVKVAIKCYRSARFASTVEHKHVHAVLLFICSLSAWPSQSLEVMRKVLFQVYRDISEGRHALCCLKGARSRFC